MMKNKFTALLMAVVFMTAMTVPALAAPMHHGRPTAYDSNTTMGYHIWQDGNRWNVRTVNANAQHLFTGTIETDGSFSDVSVIPSDKIERVAVDVRSQRIDFHFNSQARTDGFSFTLTNSQNAAFTLYVDGQPVNPANVFLGQQNRHPDKHNFPVNATYDNATNNPANNNWGNSTYNQTNTSADSQGQPTALSPGAVFGYFIWQDQNRWMMQTTTTGGERQFTGTIETNGTLSDVTTMKAQRADGATVSTESNKINFAFKTGGSNMGLSISLEDGLRINQTDKLSGLSFLVTDSASVKFTLYADGQAVDPANIYIGRVNRHPSGSGVTIYSRNQ